MKELTLFIKTIRSFNKISEIYQYIRDEYFTFFGEHVPPNRHIEFARYRLEYAMMKKGYDDGGVVPPDFVVQNNKAAQAWDVEAFTPSIKQLLKIALTTNKEDEMATATKNRIAKAPSTEARAAVKKAVGTQETVTQSYIRLFSANAKDKLSDKQMALKMRQLHPDKKAYDENDISAVRSMYNRGKLSGQKTKPVESYVHEAVTAKK